MYEIILVARYRKPRLSQFLMPVNHADTAVFNVGASSAPSVHIILDTEVGARTTTGGAQTIQVGQGTNEEVNVGSQVKYINLFLQGATKAPGAPTVDDVGWLEWAVVMVKETETVLPITNLGTLTVGVVANHMYRNECIWTGCLPIGGIQPNYQEIKIKVPKFKQKIRIGDQWRFIIAYRDVKATSTGTDDVRIVSSVMFKSWN